MNIFLKKILPGLICFFVFSQAIAQTNFYSVASPEIISKDEYFTYRIIVENPGTIRSITPPNLKNFIIVRGPMQEDGLNSVNGRSTQYVSLVFVLKPKQSGKFRIGPAKATINGKNAESNSVALEVSKNSSSANVPAYSMPRYDPYDPRRPASDFKDYIFHDSDNIAEKVNRNMQLRLEVDKKTCYVGEPVVAVYKLYTRLKSESKLIQNPAFNGFSVIDLQQPDITGYSKARLNGKEYNVYTIRKAQLYALQPGLINLESAEIENNIQFIKEAYAKKLFDIGNFLEDFGSSVLPPDAVINQTVNLKSNPVSITVKPLPAENRPASFKGAVGNFSISCNMAKKTFSTDEAGKLFFTISGHGNMQLLTAPDISWPAAIEFFEPRFSEKIEQATVPVSGSKTFEYSFSANDSGHYTIPPIEFSYFDPASASYKSVETQPLDFTVTKGKGQPFVFNNSVLKDAAPSLLSRLINNRWLLMVIIAGLMIGGMVWWILSDKRKTQAVIPEPVVTTDTKTELEHLVELSAGNQQNALPQSEQCLYENDCLGFYTFLNSELKDYLSQKFEMDHNTINANNIAILMDKKGISNDIVLNLQKLMHELEWQLFTPFERNERMDVLYQQAQDIIQMINGYDIRHM